jgi:hypothetical protein
MGQSETTYCVKSNHRQRVYVDSGYNVTYMSGKFKRRAFRNWQIEEDVFRAAGAFPEGQLNRSEFITVNRRDLQQR